METAPPLSEPDRDLGEPLLPPLELCDEAKSPADVESSPPPLVENDGGVDDNQVASPETAESAAITRPLVLSVSVASVSQFLLGYNTGVMNAPHAVVFPGHSTGVWSLAVAAFAVGGAIGAAVGGPISDSRGRRGAILLCTGTYLIGGVLQSFAPNMALIVAGRFVIGLASGTTSTVGPVYLGEVAPPSLRGALGTLFQLAIVVGILSSNLLAFPFATESMWRFLFLVTSILSAMQLFCFPLLLESPRWLLSCDRDSQKARTIMKLLRGLQDDNEIEVEVDRTMRAVQSDNPNASGEEESQSTVAGLFTDKKVRRLVVCSLVLQMAQQLSGINAVFYYSTMFFNGVIENPLVGTTMVGAVNVLATLLALVLMDYCGRRTLILCSAGGMFLCCIVLILTFLGYLTNLVALAAVNLFVSFFELGLGPIPFLIVPEMFQTKYVSTAMAVSLLVNWVCNFIVGLIFPFLDKYLGPYSFVPFAVILLSTFIFVFLQLPETQGKTHEEIHRELEGGSSTAVNHNAEAQNTHND